MDLTPAEALTDRQHGPSSQQIAKPLPAAPLAPETLGASTSNDGDASHGDFHGRTLTARLDSDSDGHRKPKRPFLGKLFAAWNQPASPSVEDTSLRDEDRPLSSGDFDSFMPHEREEFRFLGRGKQSPDTMTERLRMLSRRLAQESNAANLSSYTGVKRTVPSRVCTIDVKRGYAIRSASIADLQREILQLQQEVSAYRSTEWRPVSTLSMAPKLPGSFLHQQADLTIATHAQFQFKGVVIVSNMHNQVIDSFDVVPDKMVSVSGAAMASSPPPDRLGTHHGRSSAGPSSPMPERAAREKAAVETRSTTNSPAAKLLKSLRPLGGSKKARSTSTVPVTASGIIESTTSSLTSSSSSPAAPVYGASSSDGLSDVSSSSSAKAVMSQNQPPSTRSYGRPGSNMATGSSDEHGTEAAHGDHLSTHSSVVSSLDAWTDHLTHEISGLALPLHRKQTDSVLRPESVTLLYYLRGPEQTRYDCLFAFTITLDEVFSELTTCLRERGGIKTFRPTHGRKPSQEELSVRLSASEPAAPIFSFALTNATAGCEIKTYFDAHLPSGSGEPYAILSGMTLSVPLVKDPDAFSVRRVHEPVLTSKTIQNFWFRLEVEPPKKRAAIGPFFPSEQLLALEESHYYVSQEIALADVCVLGPSVTLEGESPYESVFTFRCYIRDRSHVASSIFQLASFELSLAEIVKASQGFQKLRDRFKLEKQVELGVVRGTFHFYVREEVIPEPSTTGEAIQPICGAWMLERVQLDVRIS